MSVDVPGTYLETADSIITNKSSIWILKRQTCSEFSADHSDTILSPISLV